MHANANTAEGDCALDSCTPLHSACQYHDTSMQTRIRVDRNDEPPSELKQRYIHSLGIQSVGIVLGRAVTET